MSRAIPFWVQDARKILDALEDLRRSSFKCSRCGGVEMTVTGLPFIQRCKDCGLPVGMRA